MLHHKAPHREWAPDPRNKGKFADAEFPEPVTFRDDYATRPAALPENRQTIARDLTRADLKLEPLAANIDLAPTFLDLAGLPIPESMQGTSLVPLLRGEAPAGWRQSVYYRYYHDPGHHDTRAHYGVRTATHKLIRYWKKDAWELFDLVADPHEQHNLLFDASEAASPLVAKLFATLEAEIGRLQREYADDGLYADPATWPKTTVDGMPGDRPALGEKTVAEAISLTGSP